MLWIWIIWICICYLLNHTKTACTCFQWLLSQWKCSAMTVPPLWVGKLRCWVSLKCNDYFYYKLVKVILYPLLFFHTVDAIWWHTFGKNVSVNDNEWCCVTSLGHVHCCCRRTGYISVNINVACVASVSTFFLLSSQVSRQTRVETLATQANINGS